MLQEKTWAEVTTPDSTDHCPIGDDNDTFRHAVLSRLEDVEHWPDVQGVIYFLNVDMSSSQLGKASMMPYGPGCTIEDIEKVKENPMAFFLGDVPSRRQYPQWYISRERHLASKKPITPATGC